MPLGTQQNNDFAQVTIDVWNDKVFIRSRSFLRDLWLRPF